MRAVLLLVAGFCGSVLACTSLHGDPYASGAHVTCCQGLTEELRDWNGDGRYYYKCEGGEPPAPEPTGKRIGSFLVLGDWGFDSNTHGNVKVYAISAENAAFSNLRKLYQSNQCQKSIAALMAETAADQGDVKFVLNVGDSFYPAGVYSKTDPKWQVNSDRGYFVPDGR
jgi:hypothetical protein